MGADGWSEALKKMHKCVRLKFWTHKGCNFTFHRGCRGKENMLRHIAWHLHTYTHTHMHSTLFSLLSLQPFSLISHVLCLYLLFNWLADMANEYTYTRTQTRSVTEIDYRKIRSRLLDIWLWESISLLVWLKYAIRFVNVLVNSALFGFKCWTTAI